MNTTGEAKNEFDIVLSRPSHRMVNKQNYNLDWFQRNPDARPYTGPKKQRGMKRVRAILRDDIERKKQSPNVPITLDRVPLNVSDMRDYHAHDVALANKVYKPAGFRQMEGASRYGHPRGKPAYMSARIGQVVNKGRRLRPSLAEKNVPPLPRLLEPVPPTPPLPRIKHSK